MPFYVSAALQAGFVGTLAMSLLMSMARAMGMTRMPSFEVLNGAMVSRDARTAEPMGAFVHWIVMGTVVFGIMYALLFQVFTPPWLAGLIIGIVHGLIVGVVAMPMMPMVHPAMRPATAGGEGLHIDAPGVLGKNWGPTTPLGVIVGHAVYGLVVGTVYGVLVAHL